LFHVVVFGKQFGIVLIGKVRVFKHAHFFIEVKGCAFSVLLDYTNFNL